MESEAEKQAIWCTESTGELLRRINKKCVSSLKMKQLDEGLRLAQLSHTIVQAMKEVGIIGDEQ